MKCNSCGGEIVFDYALQAYVCTRCGVVIDDRPIVNESRLLSCGEQRERIGSGFFTYRVHYHGIGDTLSERVFRDKLIIRHLDIIMKERKRLYKALKYLNKIAKAMNAPGVVYETAGKIISQYIKNTAYACYRETSMMRDVAASIYIALKLHGYKAALSEISELTGIDPLSLWRGVRRVYEATGVKPGLPSPVDFLHEMARGIGVDYEVESLASRILVAAYETGLLGGVQHKSLSAGALYLASVLLNKRISQERFKRLGRSDAAVRNAAKRLLRSLDIEVLL